MVAYLRLILLIAVACVAAPFAPADVAAQTARPAVVPIAPFHHGYEIGPV